jgi:hypothetical protein
MTTAGIHPPYDRFLETADAVAAARPEVDLEIAREIFTEVATTLYNGLALDGLDVHDTESVIAGLCIDLVNTDPAGAVRARARTILETTGEVHDREAVSAAYIISAAMLKL